jgi:UDP-glucose 4-epimerase
MPGDRPIVLLTGASGFVGRHLSPALSREGWAVRHAVRHSLGAENEVVIQPIDSKTDWNRALVGVDAVVHLAARVHQRHDSGADQLYREVNTEGTLHLARCAIEARVRKFVFVSTVLVHGRSSDGRAPFSEQDAPTPQGSYGISKAEAEKGLHALAQGSEMAVTIVRPPLVYGSGAKGNFASLTKAVKLGLPLPFASIRNHRAFVSVENLASFVVHRLANPGGRFDVFLVADAEQVSTPEFIRRLASAAGAKAHLFPMPPFLLGALLKVSGRPETRDSLIGSLELNVSKAASASWRPQFTLDEGLRLALSSPAIEAHLGADRLAGTENL